MKIVLLAGGKSSRMGIDKTTLIWCSGKSTLQQLFEVIAVTKHETYLSVRDSQSTLNVPYPIIEDLLPNKGPLGVLHSAIKRWNEPILLVACDLFLLDSDTIHSLITAHDDSQLATCFTNRLDQRVEPLCAIYQPECLNQLDKAMQHQHLCARHFLESLRPRILTLQNPVALDNINTPNDWLEAKQKKAHGTRAVSVKISYYAALREKRGCHEEIYTTLAHTAIGLFSELDYLYRFNIDPNTIRVAKNAVFVAWDSTVEDNDEFVFMQPFSGG